MKEALIGRIPWGEIVALAGLRMAARLFEIEMQRTPMIHLSKMCIRTGFVSCAKFFVAPTVLHRFNSCECLIQVMFSVNCDLSQSFCAASHSLVLLANVAPAAVWHFSK